MKDKVILLIGPLLWVLMLMLPIDASVTQLGVLGVVLWTVWYWATGAVPLWSTIFIPLIGLGVLPDVDWGFLIKSFAHPSVMLLLAPGLMVMTWVRWGLTKRVSLIVLSKWGSSIRKQSIIWLTLSTVLSSVSANVVTAIALTPLVVEMLREMGYDSPKKIVSSRSALHLLFSVAIGASLGGFVTPMAGGQAVITWGAAQDVLGSISFLEWASRTILPTILTWMVVTVIFWITTPKDAIRDMRFVYKEKLYKMHPMSYEEKVSGGLFLFVIAMLFTEDLWIQFIPGGINLSLIFVLLLVAAMMIPTLDRKSTLLNNETMKLFPISAFMLWPIAMALSEIITETGTGEVLSPLLGNFWSMSPIIGVGLVVLVIGLIAQIASDTGTAGIFAPIILTLTVASGQNTFFWLLVMGFTANLSFSVPSATGTMAVPLALEGKSTKKLFMYGFPIALICMAVSWGFWTIVMSFGLEFWFGV